jgi:hypothetical protein
LRLSFWINKCRIIPIHSFDVKFKEVKEELALGGNDKLAEGFIKRCRLISKILLNDAIPKWDRDLHKTCFLNELNKFRTTVSSFVSEFMLAAICATEGFEIHFPRPIESEKICDIILNLLNVEVKTILDRIEFANSEETLCKELEEPLKKKKVGDHINDALSKHPDMIFLVLTFTSAGISLSEHTINTENHSSIQKTLNQATMLSHSNSGLINTQKPPKEIPLVIFVTNINASNRIYRVLSLLVSYPIMIIDGELKADREKLRINL